MLTIRHKIGATLDLSGPILTAGGKTADFTGWTAASQMRAQGFVHDLDCDWRDASRGIIGLRAAPADQAHWRPMRVMVDIRMTSPAGVVLTTTSVSIDLIDPVTVP